MQVTIQIVHIMVASCLVSTALFLIHKSKQNRLTFPSNGRVTWNKIFWEKPCTVRITLCDHEEEAW